MCTAFLNRLDCWHKRCGPRLLFASRLALQYCSLRFVPSCAVLPFLLALLCCSLRFAPTGAVLADVGLIGTPPRGAHFPSAAVLRSSTAAGTSLAMSPAEAFPCSDVAASCSPHTLGKQPWPAQTTCLSMSARNFSVTASPLCMLSLIWILE